MKAARRSLGRIAAVLAVIAAIAAPLAAGDESGDPALKNPKLASDTAPETYRVKVSTTKGDFVIEVFRQWAPHGADRFYNLVKVGFFDDTAFFRVIDGFMAQVGMSGDPEIQAAWSGAPIPDDPIVKDNTRGMVTFAAKSAPDSRTTQFFINYGDNTHLRQYGKFAPFGQVVEGMEVVDSLYSGYGEGAPRGRGPSQAAITQRGAEYLKKEFPELDYITQATLVTR